MDDVILNKIASIQRCLKRVRDAYGRESELAFADDFDKQDIIVTTYALFRVFVTPSRKTVLPKPTAEPAKTYFTLF